MAFLMAIRNLRNENLQERIYSTKKAKILYKLKVRK